MQKALITLHGSPVSQEIPVYGAKSLSCRFCTLDLHGKPLLDGRTHTKLASTANVGDTSIWLMEPVTGTGLGDHADVDGGQRHDGGGRDVRRPPRGRRARRRLPAQAGGPAAVRAPRRDLPARRRPLGRVSRQRRAADAHRAGAGHDALLAARQARRRRAALGGSESLTARIEDIELRFAGQAFRLGRYPIHFHAIGNVRNSYARSNSIHHSFNRAITIHGVHYLRVRTTSSSRRWG